MSGILERIEAKLDQLLASGANVAATAPQPVAQTQTLAPAGGQPLAAADPLAGAGAALGGGTAYPTVSAEQITALITPHVGNPNLKASLQQQMAAMGIGALPDAQPHQYGELYHRFTQVINQFAAAAQQQVQPAATPASII